MLYTSPGIFLPVNASESLDYGAAMRFDVEEMAEWAGRLWFLCWVERAGQYSDLRWLERDDEER